MWGLLSTRRVWIEIIKVPHMSKEKAVTLHTESMDWNLRWLGTILAPTELLSTRRVWIEIPERNEMNFGVTVTLHTESMDWNVLPHRRYDNTTLLLSTRRVWIEIVTVGAVDVPTDVTLHTESMDWNLFLFNCLYCTNCYSPHGEYGLKFSLRYFCFNMSELLSTRRVWIEIEIDNWYDLNKNVTLHTESMDWNRAALTQGLSYL